MDEDEEEQVSCRAMKAEQIEEDQCTLHGQTGKKKPAKSFTPKFTTATAWPHSKNKKKGGGWASFTEEGRPTRPDCGLHNMGYSPVG
jgi:hypothetical protein